MVAQKSKLTCPDFHKTAQSSAVSYWTGLIITASNATGSENSNERQTLSSCVSVEMLHENLIQYTNQLLNVLLRQASFAHRLNALGTTTDSLLNSSNQQDMVFKRSLE